MSIYNQLADANEIRLLYLHCGRKGEPIECTIKHHLFSSKLAYEALSYEWGKSDRDVAPIQLNHSTHHVRKNLWQALQHLRSKERPRIFWVDALCINQRDVKERNHQVSQMGKIYESATNVVVWLGHSDCMSSWALKFLLEIRVGELATRYKMFCQGDTRTRIAKDTLEAVSVLCQRPYWNRLWIIQEIVLA
ncbi:HET-domain-containing protein, partial [Hyaloscypha variabilis F]